MFENSSLTPEQREAVTMRNSAVHVMAGAGSGKTTVLVERYLSHLREGAKPREILAVTFTKDAAEQMRTRLLARLEDGASAEIVESVRHTPNLATIHGFCYRVLNQFGSHLGLAPISGIVSVFDRARLFESRYRAWLRGLDEDSLRRWLGLFTATERRNAVQTICESREWNAEIAEPVTETEREIWRFVRGSLAPLLEAIRKETSDKGLYGFDDLEWYTLRLMKECPEVAARLQASTRHLLVDEFQDTSRRQWDILNLLVADHPERLFLVGDPKQSIYGFRNAEVALFLETKEAFATKGGAALELSTNFRARPALLAGINSLSRGLFSTPEIPFAPMESGREEGESGEPGSALSVVRFEDHGEIAEAVLHCGRLLDQGHRPDSIALLFRVSDRISDFQEALRSAGIPATGSRSLPLFERYDFLDIASFLKVIADPTDDRALAEFLRSPFIGLTPAQLGECMGRAGATLFERVMGDPGLAWLVSLVESGELDTERVLSTLWGSCQYWPSDAEAVTALYTGLGEGRLSVVDALERIESWKRGELSFPTKEGARAGAIRLSTVHGAKGLEFPHVCLVDNARLSPRVTAPLLLRPRRPAGIKYRFQGELVNGPDYEILKEEREAREKEESKRILYVALTRARDTLTVFLPRKPAPKGSWAAWLDDELC